METSINTRLTWAVPVKPDLLGKSLQAFKETLPTLRALRLCHRFGKGSKAYITKLPIEVERIIEGFVPLCRSTLWQSFFWEENFNHFEKRCEPADHVEECYLDIWEDVESELHEELCESCQTDGTFDNELNCTSDCHFEVHMKMNQRIQENYDHAFEVCDNFSRAWENSIAQKADGHFVQYDQHFGLGAYFAHTRINATGGPWTDETEHIWHEQDELQTTICYLTLPNAPSVKSTFEATGMEQHCGLDRINGHQSCYIGPVDLTERDKVVKRFQHALHALSLAPYIHPSQLNHTLPSPGTGKAAASVAPAITAKTSDNNGEATKGPMPPDLPQTALMKQDVATKPQITDWPKLVLLIEATSDPNC